MCAVKALAIGLSSDVDEALLSPLRETAAGDSVDSDVVDPAPVHASSADLIIPASPAASKPQSSPLCELTSPSDLHTCKLPEQVLRSDALARSVTSLVYALTNDLRVLKSTIRKAESVIMRIKPNRMNGGTPVSSTPSGGEPALLGLVERLRDESILDAAPSNSDSNADMVTPAAAILAYSQRKKPERQVVDLVHFLSDIGVTFASEGLGSVIVSALTRSLARPPHPAMDEAIVERLTAIALLEHEENYSDILQVMLNKITHEAEVENKFAAGAALSALTELARQTTRPRLRSHLKRRVLTLFSTVANNIRTQLREAAIEGGSNATTAAEAGEHHHRLAGLLPAIAELVSDKDFAATFAPSTNTVAVYKDVWYNFVVFGFTESGHAMEEIHQTVRRVARRIPVLIAPSEKLRLVGLVVDFFVCGLDSGVFFLGEVSISSPPPVLPINALFLPHACVSGQCAWYHIAALVVCVGSPRRGDQRGD